MSSAGEEGHAGQPNTGEVLCLAADQFYRMVYLEWLPSSGAGDAADEVGSASTVFAGRHSKATH
jgi:hypothetical protein